MEELLEMDGGDGFTAASVCLASVTVHLTTVKMENFMLCILYHNKKKESNYL